MRKNIANCILEFVVGWVFFYFAKQYEPYTFRWALTMAGGVWVLLILLAP
jgi:hypothetical protein